MNQSLLIELGTEDLPARYVQPLTQALAQGIGGGLSKRGVAIGESRSFATPLVVSNDLVAAVKSSPGARENLGLLQDRGEQTDRKSVV